ESTLLDAMTSISTKNSRQQAGGRPGKKGAKIKHLVTIQVWKRIALARHIRNQTLLWRGLEASAVVCSRLRCGTTYACRRRDLPGRPRLQRLAERGVIHFNDIAI